MKSSQEVLGIIKPLVKTCVYCVYLQGVFHPHSRIRFCILKSISLTGRTFLKITIIAKKKQVPIAKKALIKEIHIPVQGLMYCSWEYFI